MELIVLLDDRHIKLMLIQLSKIFVSFLGIVAIVLIRKLRLVKHVGLICRHGLSVLETGRAS